MERSKISFHEIKVYRVLSSASPDRWLTSADIATKAELAPRTARSHTLRFVKLGLLDQAEVFPAHRYRWSKKANRRNVAYLQRLEFADEVFKQEAA